MGRSLARFLSDTSSAIVDEPFIWMTLGRWLQSSRKWSLGSLLQRKLSNPQVQIPSHTLADAMTLALWKLFASKGAPLTTILSFEATPPEWARLNVKLVTSTPGVHQRTILLRATCTAAGPLLFVADDPQGVQRWFTEGNFAPFLRPDIGFGPSIIFQLSTPTNDVFLVCIELNMSSSMSQLEANVSYKGFYKGVGFCLSGQESHMLMAVHRCLE